MSLLPSTDQTIRLAVINEELQDPLLSVNRRELLLKLKSNYTCDAPLEISWKQQLINRIDKAIDSGKGPSTLLIDLREYISGEIYPRNQKHNRFSLSKRKLGILLSSLSIIVIIIILLY